MKNQQKKSKSLSEAINTAKTVYVHSYVRTNGVRVKQHYRSAPHRG